jgi:polysaccharide export outer membrane protein
MKRSYRTLFLLAGAAFGAAAQPAAPRAFTEPAPSANLPLHRVGANDLLSISVYGSPELTRTVRVAPDGTLRLPLLKDPLPAAGLMPVELEQRIAQALEQAQILVSPVVSATVAEYASRPISVIGAVKMPVRFQAVGETTLIDAITRAGGLDPQAGAEILISRHDAQGRPLTVQRISVQRLIDRADPSANLTLTGGEEVRVPEAGRVFVVGNVKKPGAFTVRDPEESTVLRLLARAEGLAPFAGKTAYLYRREASGTKSEITVPLAAILRRRAPDVPLQPDDVFYIPDNTGRRIGLAAMERVLLFGSTAGATALIYGSR